MRDPDARPLVTAIGALAAPAILSFLLQNLYHVNDAWFLGRAGQDATNAMGLFMMVSIANFGFILTLARGTQSLVGRRFGAGNHEGVQLALAQGLRLAAMVLVPLGVVEWLAIPRVLEAMGGEGGTVTAGTTYVRSLLLFLPALFASPLIDFSLQGMGDTRTPFKLQLVAVSVNTLLNTLLVLPHVVDWLPEGTGGRLTWAMGSMEGTWRLPFGPGEATSLGFGGLGVAGAAVATGVSRLTSASIGFLVLLRRRRMTRLLEPASYRLDRATAREILRVGVPAGSATFFYAAVAAVIVKIIGRFGQDAYGAYGIGFRGIESLSFMVVLGFGVATGTVVSHAVGAGDMIRARRAAHVGVALSAGCMFVTTLIMLSLPEALAAVFTDDAAIAAVASGYISIMAWCQVPQAFEMVYADAMAGAGSSLLNAFVSIPGNLLRIPLALWFAGPLGLGLEGVWYAILASALIKGGGMAALYLSGRWESGMRRGQGAVKQG